MWFVLTVNFMVDGSLSYVLVPVIFKVYFSIISGSIAPISPAGIHT